MDSTIDIGLTDITVTESEITKYIDERDGGWFSTDRRAAKFFGPRVGPTNYYLYSVICSFASEPSQRSVKLRLTPDRANPDTPSLMGFMPPKMHPNTVRDSLAVLRAFGLIATTNSPGKQGEMVYELLDTRRAKAVLLAKEAQRNLACGLGLDNKLQSPDYSFPINYSPQTIVSAINYSPQTIVLLAPNRDSNREEDNRDAAEPLLVVAAVKEAVKPVVAKASRKGKAFPDHAPNDFLEVKASYPSKGSLQESITAWDNLKPSPELCASLKVYAVNYAAFSSEHTPWQFIPHLCRWLSAGRYNEPQSTISGFDDTKPVAGQIRAAERRTAASNGNPSAVAKSALPSKCRPAFTEAENAEFAILRRENIALAKAKSLIDVAAKEAETAKRNATRRRYTYASEDELFLEDRVPEDIEGDNSNERCQPAQHRAGQRSTDQSGGGTATYPF